MEKQVIQPAEMEKTEKRPFKSGFVAIIGRPNVGKSTLMNLIMGQKLAIMSDKPQTTRNKIRCIYTSEEGQIIFIDTPGIHKPLHRLGEYMVQLSLKTMAEVDVILYVIEACSPLGGGDRYILKQLQQVKTPVVLAVNKMDLVKREDSVDALIDSFRQEKEFAAVVKLSALAGGYPHELIRILLDLLPEGPMYYPADVITEQPERFIVAELIREKVLHLTREEIPHAVAVEVEEMVKRKNDLVYIRAVIYTERDSQKGIIVGKNGSMLKNIGTLARQEIENLLGSKVYLDLWVKVKKDWRNKESFLRPMFARELE